VPTDDDSAMLSRIRLTLEEAGMYIGVDLRDGVVSLSGAVESDESRTAAIDVASAASRDRGYRIEDDLDVLQTAPDAGFLGADDAGGGADAFIASDVNRDGDLDAAFESEPDFAGSVGTTNSEAVVEDGRTYFAPTDPVVLPSEDDQQLQVVGGFGETSVDSTEGAASFDDRNDQDITPDVLRALRKDALTTDLHVRVSALDGVVHLHGQVESPEDAENAEAVGSRIGGAKEVREELKIVGPCGLSDGGATT